MRLKEFLQEEYVTSLKLPESDRQYPIFINPTSSELVKLHREAKWDEVKGIRFILDRVGNNLFVFNINLLHWLALGILQNENHIKKGQRYDFNGKPNWNYGQGIIKTGKISIITIEDKLTSIDLEWCSKYFNMDKRFM
jgi:hypothetical protein